VVIFILAIISIGNIEVRKKRFFLFFMSLAGQASFIWYKLPFMKAFFRGVAPKPLFFLFAINCRVDIVLCKGEENPLVRASGFPPPYITRYHKWQFIPYKKSPSG